VTALVERPAGHDDSVFVVSVSGGKDSTAALLAMREAGIPCRAVFADTGWEAPETYDHLLTLERILDIKVERVGVLGGMRAKIRARAGFPARMQRWCTRELKVEPIRAFHDGLIESEGCDTVSVVGLRAEESEARAALREYEFDVRWNGYVWRPILRWSVADVLAIHHRHGIPVNPLYRKGHSRVGCWPCIYASKDQIRLWAEQDPASVAEIEALEAECGVLRSSRNKVEPGRYSHAQASYFQSRKAVKGADGRRVYLPMAVREVVEWSMSAHGGAQGVLIREDPDSGCFRWGLCDPPSPEVDEVLP